MSEITAFLITGPPGVGKTTVVRKICTKLWEHNKLQGFYTEEVRASGRGRIGFDVVTLAGARGILARETPKDNVQRPKVGKYAVYVQDFESLALPLLQVTPSQLLVIDEIGKMELFSKRFEMAVGVLLQHKQPLLATIPQQTRQILPLVERLRSAKGVQLYQVTKANRDKLVNEISECILKAYVITK